MATDQTGIMITESMRLRNDMVNLKTENQQLRAQLANLEELCRGENIYHMLDRIAVLERQLAVADMSAPSAGATGLKYCQIQQSQCHDRASL